MVSHVCIQSTRKSNGLSHNVLYLHTIQYLDLFTLLVMLFGISWNFLLLKCTCFFNVGSKEEVFFDSQAWLESDCEDFFSINGGKVKVKLNFSWKEIHFFSWLSSEEAWYTFLRAKIKTSIA